MDFDEDVMKQGFGKLNVHHIAIATCNEYIYICRLLRKFQCDNVFTMCLCLWMSCNLVTDLSR